VGVSPGLVKPKSIKLIFAASVAEYHDEPLKDKINLTEAENKM
jgi:hypothetical protein